MSVASLATGAMGFHSGVSAPEVTAPAALPDGELRQAAFFFLAFDSGELRSDKRAMHRPFLRFRRSF
jgi:hypothetical protein